MDIIEKLRNSKDFTNTENTIIEVILNNPDIMDTNITARKLGEKAYTSASSVVRLCKKVGCDSYNEFKIRFVSQWKQREKATLFIDASIPFRITDSQEDILSKITELEKITVDQTYHLINQIAFDRIIHMLNEAENIDIYGHSDNVRLCNDFKQKLGTIHKRVNLLADTQEQLTNSLAKVHNTCAILVSYSGENRNTLLMAKNLKDNKIPTISLTNKEWNPLMDLTNEHLFIASLEHTHHTAGKIGLFSSNISITTIMNYLYAGIFALEYEKNYQTIINDRLLRNEQII